MNEYVIVVVVFVARRIEAGRGGEREYGIRSGKVNLYKWRGREIEIARDVYNRYGATLLIRREWP